MESNWRFPTADLSPTSFCWAAIKRDL